MEYRQLGDSDLKVSAISLGSWLTYAGAIQRDQAEACTRAAFEAGINFFDTANIYGRGVAEEAWGEILPRYPRDSWILATKLFWPMVEGETGGLSAEEVHKQIDESLKRLRVDHIDLYQCHRYDAETPIEETLEALQQVIDAGKTRYVGFSEWAPVQIQAAVDVCAQDPKRYAKFVSSQPEYHMLWRGSEAEVFPLCVKNGISQIVWCPLAQGVLTGKYKPGQPPPEGSRAADPKTGRFMEDDLSNEAKLEAVQTLEPIARDEGLTMAQLALAWVLRRSELASAIIGASRPEQVHENAVAAGKVLSSGTLDAIEVALGDQVVSDYHYMMSGEPTVKHRE